MAQMPTINTRIPKRTQTCLHWVRGVSDGRGGWAYTNAVEVKCRFEESSDEFVDDAGDTQISRATVYPVSDMSTGDFVWLGLITDLASAESVSSNPNTISGASEVRKFESVPDFKAKKVLRIAYL